MYGIVAPSNRLHHTAYATSKHGEAQTRPESVPQWLTNALIGVIGLTKADANSYGGVGIRINAICPGYIRTPLLEDNMSQDADSPLQADLSRTPFKRLATMEEIADSIVIMASPMASFMQGAAMVVDGGFTTN